LQLTLQCLINVTLPSHSNKIHSPIFVHSIMTLASKVHCSLQQFAAVCLVHWRLPQSVTCLPLPDCEGPGKVCYTGVKVLWLSIYTIVPYGYITQKKEK
jgi:hypothetical protein